MDAARLVAGYQSIMRTIYNPREYYQRALDSLKRTPVPSWDSKEINLVRDLASFLRLTFKLGVLDRERREFWRFFVTAIAKHRAQFADSMRLAAMGYHFRKLNEAYGE
jgi:hypothetical protein